MTVFRHFPHLTASLKEFGVVGKGVFESDTLAAISSFQITVDLGSLIFGDQMRIKSIDLDRPKLEILVLEDGTANYDIALASSDSTIVEESSENEDTGDAISVAIESWSIKQGTMIYYDIAGGTFADLIGLNHSGSGDFSKNIFDMKSTTTIDAVAISQEDISYVNVQSISFDATIAMDLINQKYTFKENQIKVNDFPLSFEGYIALPPDGSYDIDLSYKSEGSTLKNLMSLIPGVFLEDYQGLQAEGDLAFGGAVKGVYREEPSTFPDIDFSLNLANGFFQYPDLPTSVKNIAVDMSLAIQNLDQSTLVLNMPKLNMDLGNNPVKGRFKLINPNLPDIDTDIHAKINLAELTQMVPIPETTLQGLFTIDVTAKGIYDSIKHQVPALDMRIFLTDGYVKSPELPEPIENIQAQVNIKNETTRMVDMMIDVPQFNLELQGEPFSATAKVVNLDNPRWDVTAKGKIDLEKILKLYPQEALDVSGIITADIATQGNMQAVEKSRYDQLPTRGTMTVQNLKYTSDDLPEPLTISQATVSLDPKKINILKFQGAIGSSDFDVNGSVSNYIGYILSEQTLRGEMNFNASNIDLNELSPTEETASGSSETTVEEDTASSEETIAAVEVPSNIDFTLHSNIKKVKYTNLDLDNLKGDFIIRNGVVTMKGFGFNLLGGDFAMNGAYDGRDIEKPKYDFDVDIKELSIQQAYQNFVMVKSFAPIAQAMDGDFSLDFKLNGLLNQDMTPDLASINASGIVKILQAVLKDNKLISGINKFSLKGGDTERSLSLKNLIVNAKIQDGRLSHPALNVNIGKYPASISGSIGLDQSLDYNVVMDVPAGVIGQQVNRFLSGGQSTSSSIKVPVSISGTYNNPQFGPGKLEGGSESGGGVSETVKEALDDHKEAVKDSVNSVVEQQKAEAAKKAAEAKQKAEEEAKKQAKRAAEEARKKAEEAKKKLKKKLKKIF